ncbi:MAG: cadherin-like domain-containing protein, partial [Weeksellaceae bacterium]
MEKIYENLKSFAVYLLKGFSKVSFGLPLVLLLVFAFLSMQQVLGLNKINTPVKNHTVAAQNQPKIDASFAINTADVNIGMEEDFNKETSLFSAMGSDEAPCNEASNLTTDVYSNLVVTSSKSGLFQTDDFQSKNNLIDPDPDKGTSWSAAILGSAWIEVKDNNAVGDKVYPAGSYAGFIINNLNLLSLGATIKVETFLGNTSQESVSNGEFVSTFLESGRKRIGFVTTKPFDRIRLTSNAGISLTYTLTVYYAQILKPCTSPEPDCNLPTALVQANSGTSTPGHGVIVETARSGLGGVTVGTFQNAQNVVDSDPDNFMTMSVNVGIVGSASISVRDLDEVFPAGYFAGFNISNSDILALDLFGNSEIRTYLNGVLQDSSSAGVSLVKVPLLSGSARHTIGLVTTKPFNEIRYTINQTSLLNLGVTAVYHAVVKKYCEGDTLDCNEPTSLTVPDFPVDLNMDRTGITGGACAACELSNLDYILDSNTGNFASVNLTAGVGVTGSVAVKNGFESFDAGTFAGFEMSSATLLDISLFDNLEINTYNDGILKETVSGTSLLVSGDVLNASERFVIGFVTQEDFDELQLKINNTGGVDLGVTNVYGAIVKKYCDGEELVCNTNTALIIPDYPVDLSLATTGITGGVCAACEIKNPGRVLDQDPDNYAIIDLTGSALVSGNLGVKLGTGSYPAGTYTGFEISTDELLTVSLLNNFQIKTLLNGSIQETMTGSSLILSADLLSSADRQIIGFQTTKEFDEIVFVANNPVGANLDIVRVYSSIVKMYCPGPELLCNTETMITSPEFPVDINYVRTGIEGAACALCGLDNPQYVLNDNPADYASIFLPVSVANAAGISIKNGIETWSENTYAAFEVSNPELVNAEILGGITIELYKDNQLQQSGTGAAQLVMVDTFLIGGSSHGLIGIVSNTEFDEVRFVIRNFGNVNVGLTNIHKFVVMKGCEGEFDCGTSEALVRPDYSVVIENSRTGIGSGIACVECEVGNPENLINANTDDYATIDLTVGAVGSNGSISIRDIGLTYPAGTTAGFVVRDTNPVLQVGLLSGIAIRTYLDGELQETRVGAGQLIDLNVLMLLMIGSDSNKHAVGFITSKPFNEIRITYTTLLQALNFLDVYHAFVDARFVNNPELELNCGNYIPILAVPDFNQTPVDVAVTGNVLTNDKGDTLQVSEASYMDENGNYQSLALDTATDVYDADGILAGALTLSNTGAYTFVPATGFVGTVAPVQYTATDVNGLTDVTTLTIKVLPDMNGSDSNPPVAQDDFGMGWGDMPISGNLLYNDSDPDGDDLVVTQITVYNNQGVPTAIAVPENGDTGSVVIYDENGNEVGEIVVHADGNYTFNRTNGFIGKVPPINYMITDGNGGTDNANLHLQIQPEDDTGGIYTIAKDDSNTGSKGVPQTGDIILNDSNSGNNALSVSQFYWDGDAYPVDEVNGGEVNIPDEGNLKIMADGTYTFTPEPDFVGTITVPYQACDSAGNCDNATLYATVLDTTASSCITARVLLQGGLVNVIDANIYDSDDIMRDDIRAK